VVAAAHAHAPPHTHSRIREYLEHQGGFHISHGAAMTTDEARKVASLIHQLQLDPARVAAMDPTLARAVADRLSEWIRTRQAADATELPAIQRYALAHEFVNVGRLLLRDDITVTIDDTDSTGQTALHKASERGLLEVVRFLLDHNADPILTDASGSTPLHLAALHGHTKICVALTDHISKIDIEERTDAAWQEMAARGETGTDLTQLLSRQTGVFARDKSLNTPLHLACAKGHLETVEWLLDNTEGSQSSSGLPALTNLRNAAGESCLHLAARAGRRGRKVVDLLIRRGADLESRDKKGKTPLQAAVEEGSTAGVSLLIEAGADIHTRDNAGWSLLHSAATPKGRREIIQIIARCEALAGGVKRPMAGASLDCRSRIGDYRHGWSTPLHVAAACGNAEVADALVECDRGSVWALDALGETPLHNAASKNHLAICARLIEAGGEALIEVRGLRNETALDSAMRKGHESVAYFLETGSMPPSVESHHAPGESPSEAVLLMQLEDALDDVDEEAMITEGSVPEEYQRLMDTDNDDFPDPEADMTAAFLDPFAFFAVDTAYTEDTKTRKAKADARPHRTHRHTH